MISSLSVHGMYLMNLSVVILERTLQKVLEWMCIESLFWSGGHAIGITFGSYVVPSDMGSHAPNAIPIGQPFTGLDYLIRSFYLS